MGAVRTTLTVEEFLQLPGLPAGKRELLRGELIELPPAKRKHNQAAHRMQKWLEAAVAAAGIAGEVYIEMGYRFGSLHWLQPDVSLTRPDQPGEDYFEGSPLLAVEIVSEYNTPRKINAKREEYLAHGAAEVWVIYPENRQMRIYRPGGVEEIRSGIFDAPLLGGQRIDLDAIIGE